MAVVGNLLIRRKANLKRPYYLSGLLALASMGGFLSGIPIFFIDGHPYSLSTLIISFILAIVTGAVFLWQRARIMM